MLASDILRHSLTMFYVPFDVSVFSLSLSFCHQFILIMYYVSCLCGAFVVAAVY